MSVYYSCSSSLSDNVTEGLAAMADTLIIVMQVNVYNTSAYGYLHDPQDRQKWILDEEAAPRK